MNITVLLPVYNAGNPLKSSIESILKQSHEEFEFLIIDDASTDASQETIRRYAAMDSRIRPVFHVQNQGLAATLNEGVQISEGDWIARMDQDDEALPDRLAIQSRFLSTRPRVAVAGSFVFYMGIDPGHDRLIQFPTSHEEISRILPETNCLFHPTVMMRREMILDMGGYRPEFKNAEDYDLWLRVSKQYELANIPVALLRYRFSVSGMTLGRKWEQLYYVFLAQAAYKHPELLFSDLETMAKERQASTDRVAFHHHVAEYTAEELFTLGNSNEAYQLLHQFSKEIGKPAAAGIGWKLLRNRSAIRQDKHDEWRHILHAWNQT